MARLNQIAPGISHTIYYADLSRLREMKRVAAEIAQAEPRIDVLINNAGAMFGTRQLTEDGLERTFALNHMSYFVMTQGLRERLAASAPARVVNTASDAHTSGTSTSMTCNRRRHTASILGLDALWRACFQGLCPLQADEHSLYA